MRRQEPERTFKDPVCGMELSRNTAADECAYLDKTYYFCAAACREAFEADPDQYVRHHRQHGFRLL